MKCHLIVILTTASSGANTAVQPREAAEVDIRTVLAPWELKL